MGCADTRTVNIAAMLIRYSNVKINGAARDRLAFLECVQERI